MTIDYSKIKVGDTVGLVVDYVKENGDMLVKDGFGITRVKPSAIVSHTPAPKPALKVGDRVRHLFSKTAHTILWIEHGCVWFSPTFADATIYPYALAEVETWERLS